MRLRLSLVGLLALLICPLAASASGPEPDLVRVDQYLPQVIIDLRYASTNNFTRKKLYQDSQAWLRPDALRALRKVVKELRLKGYKLVILDAYRPPSIQAKLWAANPDPDFLAAPWEVSRHSRGTTVDVTLADLSGKQLEMPSDYDEFTARAHHDYADLSAEVSKRREDLRNAFFKAGFSGVENEWWHYDLKDWNKYPVVNRE